MVSSRGLKSGVLVPISISLIRLWYRRTEFLKTFSFNSSSLKMVLSMGKKCGCGHGGKQMIYQWTDLFLLLLLLMPELHSIYRAYDVVYTSVHWYHRFYTCRR